MALPNAQKTRRRHWSSWRWVRLGLWASLISILVGVVPFSAHGRDAEPMMTRGIGVEARVQAIEQTWKTQYTEYLRSSSARSPQGSHEIAVTLSRLSAATNHQLGLIYLFPQPEGLELLLVSPRYPSIRYWLPQVPETLFLEQAEQLQQQLTQPTSDRYLPFAQQLYRWLIAPLEADLQARQLDTLVFCVGTGLRSLPLSVLHDGQQFLVEKYDIGLIPAFTLTDPRYQAMTQVDVLAMGASEFDTLADLPAVAVELATIADELWPGQVHLNEDFTRHTLRQELAKNQFEIVHLATHAEFQSGEPSQSFIQLWQDEQLNLAQLRQLEWADLPVELLVLSACQTALGNPQAELGFAGLAYQAGVKSAIASLWSVSDLGTLALMREFYWQLAQASGDTKAHVLGLAQRAMIRGQVRLTPTGLIDSGNQAVVLPAALQSQSPTVDLSHPYYWSAFVLVGSPW